MKKKVIILLLDFVDFALRWYVGQVYKPGEYRKGYFVDGIKRVL